MHPEQHRAASSLRMSSVIGNDLEEDSLEEDSLEEDSLEEAGLVENSLEEEGLAHAGLVENCQGLLDQQGGEAETICSM